jgi:hypothetical protein
MLALSGFLLFADEEPLPSPPRAPFLCNAPTSAEWTVAYANKHADTNKPGKAPAASEMPDADMPTARVLKEIKVTKMAGTRREIYVWSDGQKTERWIYKGMILSEQPDLPDIYILTPNQLKGLPGSSSSEYDKSDFPELAWVSPKSYVDLARYGTHPCYHYQAKQTVDTSPFSEPTLNQAGERISEPPPATLQAWIDGSTKLPVAIDDGNSLLILSFKTSEVHDLKLPARFEKALQEYLKLADDPKKHRMVY